MSFREFVEAIQEDKHKMSSMQMNNWTEDQINDAIKKLSKAQIKTLYNVTKGDSAETSKIDSKDSFKTASVTLMMKSGKTYWVDMNKNGKKLSADVK